MSTTEQNSTETSGADAPPPEMMPLHQEFILFLKENKKWWLLPMIVMVAMLGTVLALSGSALAPFIYSLF